MRVRCECGREVEVADSQVLSEAGRLMVARRKNHNGGAKPQAHSCRWCRTSCLGREALAVHERQCPERRAYEAVGPLDLVPASLDAFDPAD